MKLTINVTQKDIDGGYRCSSFSCPIAIAATRAISSLASREARACLGVDVDGSNLLFFRHDMPDDLKPVPHDQHDWIVAFDDGKANVKPFSFEVDIPDSDFARLVA